MKLAIMTALICASAFAQQTDVSSLDGEVESITILHEVTVKAYTRSTSMGDCLIEMEDTEDFDRTIGASTTIAAKQRFVGWNGLRTVYPHKLQIMSDTIRSISCKATEYVDDDSYSSRSELLGRIEKAGIVVNVIK